MMDKQLDDLVRHALTPEDEPDFWLNQKVFSQVEEQKKMLGRKKKRIPSVAAIAVFILCLGSVTAYATMKFLTPAGVVEEMRDEKYAGLNALFELPIDSAKADPEKAVSVRQKSPFRGRKKQPFWDNRK